MSPSKSLSTETRLAMAGTVVALAALMLGCLSVPTVGHYESGDVFVQTGKISETSATTTAGCEPGVYAVYYPIPYVSPPNLEIDQPFDHFVIVDQKPDHFEFRTTKFFFGATWTAKGMRRPSRTGGIPSRQPNDIAVTIGAPQASQVSRKSWPAIGLEAERHAPQPTR